MINSLIHELTLTLLRLIKINIGMFILYDTFRKQYTCILWKLFKYGYDPFKMCFMNIDISYYI